MLVSASRTYTREPFESEQEIEVVVQQFADQLFGSGSIYLPKAKISTLGGFGTIPDGFVIDVRRGEWYIVEAERGSHGTWEHIAPQVSKQLTAVASDKTKQTILQLALSEVETDASLREGLEELGVSALHVHRKIEAVLSRPPTIAIPIDHIPKDLNEWASTLRNVVKIWLLKKYVSTCDPTDVLYSLPDDNSPTVATVGGHGTDISMVRASGGVSIQSLVESGLLADGQTLYLDYKPKGQPQVKFEATIRKDGIEVDNHIYSPSSAALYCLRKVNSKLKARNGWDCWRTQTGEVLAAVRDRLPAIVPSESE